jgi:hypothetical protein
MKPVYSGAAVVRLRAYIKQGMYSFTGLVQEYDAGKTKYTLQKEANLLQQKNMT